MHLLLNVRVHAPEPLGMCAVLVAGERVVWIGEQAPTLGSELPVETTDLEGRALVPGFVDAHVHLSGGGGETGYPSRVPALQLSELTAAGVTTAVGLLGTDDLVRTPAEVLAHARALRALGLSTYCWTGGYHVPPATITGSVRGDIVHIDLVIGVGELALSDHRSSQPTLEELLRVASDAHVAGLMSGKAGVVHLHMGDGARGLAHIRAALSTSEIPARVFHPTHVNRREALLREAFALASHGVTIDVSAFPPSDHPDEVDADEAVVRYFDASLPVDRLTVSSDGGGCMPRFDHEGLPVGMEVAAPAELARALARLVARGVPLSEALAPFTSNPARLLRLPGKGRVEVGGHADLVALDDKAAVTHVMARGRWMVREGQAVVRGPFEAQDDAAARSGAKRAR